MQQYLTLEEAAKYLQMSLDELREMAKNKTVRAFQDRGTWRFRSQDIEELARSRGLSSDVELRLGEGSQSAPSDSKRTGKKPADSDMIPADFTLDDPEEVPLGREKSGSGAKSSKGGSRSPKPSSDSDVRLVMDGEIDFDEPAAKSGNRSGKRSSGDSGVRLVPAEDSDVRLEGVDKDSGAKGSSKSPSDSDIRLHEATPPKKQSDIGQVTEEIDLDAEAAKLELAKKKPGKTGSAGGSPFELSEPELKLPSKSAPRKPEVDSSSDFELIPFDASKSPVELGSGKIPVTEGDEEVNLGGDLPSLTAGTSGINLRNPIDSGISLEDGGSDEIDFELRTDQGSTPKPSARSATRNPAPSKPTPAKDEDDSSSEFELSLEDSSPMDNSSSEFELSLEDESPTADSSSEFELSLDDSSEDGPSLGGESASDSEFELTLDDEGRLSGEEEGDIFEETNFDVPALEDESGSEAVAIDESDSDLEGSDFEISLDDDSSAGGDSGSQVVALDDEEADAGAATVARPRKLASKSKTAAKADLEEDLDLDLDEEEAPQPAKGKAKKPKAVAAEEDEEDEEDEDLAPIGAGKPAEWGAFPAVMLFPTVIVLFLVSIMGFELLRGMYGYHRPTVVGKPVIDMIAGQVAELPK